MKKFSTKDIVLIGMLSAMCTIATFIKIPYGNGAMVHLGTAALFTIAIIFGGKYAGLSGAIGSGIYDIMMGFSPYTVWTFVIKGLAGLIVGSIAHGIEKKGNKNLYHLIGCIMGGIWTLGAYFVAWTVVLGSYQGAILNIPSSIISSAVGTVVALPVSKLLSMGINDHNRKRAK